MPYSEEAALHNTIFLLFRDEIRSEGCWTGQHAHGARIFREAMGDFHKVIKSETWNNQQLLTNSR